MKHSAVATVAVLGALLPCCAHPLPKQEPIVEAPAESTGQTVSNQGLASTPPADRPARVVVAAPPAANASVATPATTMPTASCQLEGSWHNETPGIGNSTITVTKQPNGSFTATEAGMGNFDGIVTGHEHVLRIQFHTAGGYAGVYEWSLDPSCTHGAGSLVFSAGGSGSHASTVKRAP